MFKIENHYYVIKHNIYIMDDEMGWERLHSFANFGLCVRNTCITSIYT